MNDSGAPKGATDETTAKLSGHSVDGGSDRRRIVRGPRPTRDFAILRNEVLRDTRLSFRARGILAYVLSRPDNWRESAKELAAQGREGRGAILRALTELEEAGYRRTVRRRDPVTGHMSSAVTWYDQPQPPGSRNPTPVTGVQESDPGSVHRGPEIRDPVHRDPVNRTPLEDREEDREEDSFQDHSLDRSGRNPYEGLLPRPDLHLPGRNAREVEPSMEGQEQERSDETAVISGRASSSSPVPSPLQQARAVVESVGLTDCAFVGKVTITATATVDHAADASVTTRATITAAVPAPVPDWVADLEPPNYREWATGYIEGGADPELFRPEPDEHDRAVALVTERLSGVISNSYGSTT